VWVRVERKGVRHTGVIQASGSGFRSVRAYARVHAPAPCLIQVCAFKHSCLFMTCLHVCRDFFYMSEPAHLCVSSRLVYVDEAWHGTRKNT